MYTILVTDSNELVTTLKERIMQRSKLVDNLHFLANPTYKDYDMSGFTVMMEYITPVGREYKTEILTKSDTLYKDMLEYKVPFDTCLTKEPGKVEVQLTFTKTTLDADGNAKQQVRKTSATTITIVPISAWSDIVPDSALTALDQRMVMLDAYAGQLADLGQYLFENKADNITYNKEEQSIQLTSNGEVIGDQITLEKGNGCTITDVKIDENNDLIVTLSDGRVINAGNVADAEGVTFIPHISEDYILSWTNDGGLENPEPVDLYPFDEWIDGDNANSDYTWEFI